MSWDGPSEKKSCWDGFVIGERLTFVFFLLVLYLLLFRPSCPSKNKSSKGKIEFFALYYTPEPYVTYCIYSSWFTSQFTCFIDLCYVVILYIWHASLRYAYKKKDK